ncbi:hypothetical protein GCM10022251_12850 [Phytohabitans flavus]|uniref:Uncharacterized protein n=1 Tax=Phytohabitans flavus TaxID=1076124 RepID=A0A6F8XJA1_9ACTN|nr:hypothetical protein Pflav_003040 [Phytohabitans flavus]
MPERAADPVVAILEIHSPCYAHGHGAARRERIALGRAPARVRAGGLCGAEGEAAGAAVRTTADVAVAHVFGLEWIP